MQSNYYFVIVGHFDNPLYELEVNNSKDIQKEDNRHLVQFIAHAALDFVEEHMWRTSNVWLKTVDKFNQWLVSAFVSATCTKFIVVHDSKADDHIRNFCTKVYELFVKVSMNPFYELNTPINSSEFDTAVRNIAKKYLS